VLIIPCSSADDYSTFLAHDEDGNPQNFQLSIHRETFYPMSQRVCSHTAIPPMNAAEKKGQKWA
jgi:hypothetical protein